MKHRPTYTDKDLFLLIAEGDEYAFEILFKRYLPLIQPVILQVIKSELLAKDLVQDVFLRLWLSREKLSEIQEPKSYIFRIAYNQACTYLKRQLIKEKVTACVLADQEDAQTATSLEKVLDMAEVRRMVDDAIQELPEQARRIYQLSRIYGIKPQEIADQLGISVQSVRNSLTRQGKLIREYLQRQGVSLPLLLILLSLR